MAIKVTMASGTGTLTVDYGYERLAPVASTGKVDVSGDRAGNRRYGEYKLVAANTDQHIVANTVTVDDRDLPLFNGLIAKGTVSVVDATFNQVNLASVHVGQTIAAAASGTGNLAGVAGQGYDVKLTNITPAGTNLVVAKNGANFTVSMASGTAASTVTFDYALLTYNATFDFTNDDYQKNLVTQSGGAH